MTAKNIHQRIHACMTDVDYIQKERKQGMNYTIVSHDAVTAKVRPVLHKHGIVYYPVALDSEQDGNRTQVKLRVRFANVDDPADFIEVPSLGYGIDSQDKGPGKAISYAVKYALLKTLGLETGDDPDTETVEHMPAPPPKPAYQAWYDARLAELAKPMTPTSLEAWHKKYQPGIDKLREKDADLALKLVGTYNDKWKEPAYAA